MTSRIQLHEAPAWVETAIVAGRLAIYEIFYRLAITWGNPFTVHGSIASDCVGMTVGYCCQQAESIFDRLLTA